jgi:hypothetical protein
MDLDRFITAPAIVRALIAQQAKAIFSGRGLVGALTAPG